MLQHVWVIPALMTLSFVLTLFFGKKLLGKNVHLIGITFVGVCFVLACVTGVQWIQRSNHHVDTQVEALAGVNPSCSNVAKAANAGTLELPEAEQAAPEGSGGAAAGAETEHFSRPIVNCKHWFTSQAVDVTVGTILDGQSALLLFVVTFISLLVHIFSTDYVGGDRRYTHYFAFLSLFTASMLMFVLAENTLQMIVGWELVGVCSFALIGHWWEDQPNSDAALKAFLTNRVGDIGLLVGVIVLYFGAHQSFSIMDINILSNEGGIGHTTLLVASLCLI